MQRDHQYDRPIEIAEGIFWVGFHDERSNFHCNPYLVVEGNQAVLIDAGSRPDFAVVMMKILQTGMKPADIAALIYHHYDPDLCGSMANVVGMIDNPSLKILTSQRDTIFLTFYIGRDNHDLLHPIDTGKPSLTFNNRTLHFIKTPFCHNSGSFVTYDEKTKTLFSSDLFGSFSQQWDLFIELAEACYTCQDYAKCPNKRSFCPLPDILDFHRIIMPTGKAVRHAMNKIKDMDIHLVAPQHGSIFRKHRDIAFMINKLATLDRVGIDALEPA